MESKYILGNWRRHQDVSFREPEVVILDNDPYERVYNDLPAGHLVLRKMPICEYCGTIML